MTHNQENRIIERLAVLEQQSKDRDVNVKALDNEVKKLNEETIGLKYAVQSQSDKIDNIAEILKEHAKSFKEHDEYEHDMVIQVKEEVKSLKAKIDENKQDILINEVQKDMSVKAVRTAIKVFVGLVGLLSSAIAVYFKYFKG